MSESFDIAISCSNKLNPEIVSAFEEDLQGSECRIVYLTQLDKRCSLVSADWLLPCSYCVPREALLPDTASRSGQRPLCILEEGIWPPHEKIIEPQAWSEIERRVKALLGSLTNCRWLLDCILT